MTRSTGPFPRPNSPSESTTRADPASPRETTRRRLTLLAIDDSASDLRILAREVACVAEWESELVSCQGPAEFLAALESRSFDVLLIDYTLGSVNGIELLREVRQSGIVSPAIFLTVREDARAAVEALQAGAADFISKDDLTSQGLRRAVEGAIEKRNLSLALMEYRKRLERAKESLERKNDEIRSFYRTITQELTTPLGTALELLSDLIQGTTGTLEAEQQEILEAVRESCNQIAVCLNDVLDMGRLEGGKLSLWLRPDDLGDVVERAILTLSSRAKNLGVALEMRIAAGIGPALIDRQRVNQILTNLVDRALEFTPAGGRIEVEVDQDPFDEQFLDVTVTDTGPGMSAEEVRRVQTEFCRTEAIALARGREPTGGHGEIGRGLQLCHEIVRLHGGEITVQSEVGKGTTFSFTLKKASADEADDPLDAA
jgi:signal transduction histidine kinase